MSRKTVIAAGGLLLAGGIAVLIERLIVTDREAILMAAETSAQAISRGDVAEALKVLHPQALTEAGNPEQTRAALEGLLREMPVEKVNFLVRELTVENGVGKLSIDVMILPKDAKTAGSSVFRHALVLNWEKSGEEWKVRSAAPR
ncbi:MAG: hypothetical protein FD180_1733 [Planctomycetota bacterium]|nr:MAG: hypothetical protein FD180_1733 [Planctomycetota bacterium]